MELYFVRHVQPAVKAGICYGQLDVPLAEGYEALHEEIALLLKPFDAIYTSPLQRCRSLAALLSENYIVDARLQELNFGEWEGMKWDEIDSTLMDYWGANYIAAGPPGGESLQDLVNRLKAFLQELPAHNKIAIITHAGVIRAARHILEHKPMQEVMSEKINYGGIYTFNLL